MVLHRAAQAVAGIVDAVFEARDGGLAESARLVVDRPDLDVDGRRLMPEEASLGGRHDPPVVLCDDVVDHGEMGRVEKGERVLAVVDVEVARDDVLAHDEAVAEALHGHVVQHLVVVLVAREHEADRVAGIGLELLAEPRVADVVPQAELAVADVDAGDVLQVAGADRRIHLFMVELHAELEVRDGDLGRGEAAPAAVPLDAAEQGPRTRGRIMLLGRVPVAEEAGVGHAHRAERRRPETTLHRLLRPNLVGIEQLAGHLALEVEVDVPERRNDELRAARPPIREFARRRGDAVALRRIGDHDLAAALRGRRVDGGLDRGGVVGDAVALRAEVAYIHGGEQRSGRAERDEEGKRFNEFHGGIIVDSAIPGKRTGLRDGRRG